MSNQEQIDRFRRMGDFIEAEVVRIFEKAQLFGLGPVMVMMSMTNGDGTVLRMNLHEGCFAGQEEPADFDPGISIIEIINESLAKLPGLQRSPNEKEVS